jgi:hypothetical protein
LFTKVGFAQVRSQQFSFPLSWQKRLPDDNDPKFKERLEMGMKVTCGFEMMLSDPHNIDNSSVREIEYLLDDLITRQDHLPSDAEISQWESKEDDDGWLDIDFGEFEDELRGVSSKDQGREAHGFGDRSAQENLRKIVTRFEDFLNDEGAGLGGAEIDTMDMDDDDSDIGTTSDDVDSDGEDKEVSFDENEFSRMIREMMGMPDDQTGNADPKPGSNDMFDHLHDSASNTHDIEGNDEVSIQEFMKAMEGELADAGVFQTQLQTRSSEPTSQDQSRSAGLQVPEITNLGNAQESDTDDIEIDYNLAKNLLESFKSQNGIAGPGGNLLGLMGMRLPRDEDDGH